MLTVSQHKFQTVAGKQERVPHVINPKLFSDLLQMKKTNATADFIKRLSPFLISALLLPFIAVLTFIADIRVFDSFWVQIFFFVCSEVYLLFLDFALWNYFAGKKKLRIWMIELIAEVIIISLILL